MYILPDAFSVNIYALLLLLFIYYESRRQMEVPSLQQRVFHYWILTTMVLLVSDSLAMLGHVVSSMAMIRAGHFFSYVPYSILLLLAYMYFRCNITLPGMRLKPWDRLIAVLGIADLLGVLVTPFTGWFYYLDIFDTYHRGPWFDFHMLLLFSGIAALEIMLVVYRRYISPDRFYSLLVFLVPVFLSITPMVMLHTRSYVGAGIVFSLLIIFVNVQGRVSAMDYLTQVYNRRQLDWNLQERIRQASEGRPFAAIMLDLDEFKAINDTFGHDMGDDALRNAAEVLRRSVRQNDFIGRYGGDEFCVLLGSVDSQEMLEDIVCRIGRHQQKFNTSGSRPYELHFSMGYSLYDPRQGLQAAQFLKYIDDRMYARKRMEQEKVGTAAGCR